MNTCYCYCFVFTVSNDGVRSLSNFRNDHTSNTTPVIFRTTTEQNYNERLNRLTPSRQRSNILPTYRGSTSTYDPSKSPLFSVNNRVSRLSYIEDR